MAKKKTEGTTTRPRRTVARATAPRNGAGGNSRETPTHAEIAQAAYLRYLGRGGWHGRDFDDWVEAERALRSPQSE